MIKKTKFANDKIAMPDDKNIASMSLSSLLKEAKSMGFTMILLHGNVYSIELLTTSMQSEEYLIKYCKLFNYDDLDIITEEPIRFNKSFEALSAISMKMADECIGAKTLEARFDKLEEEYRELIAEYSKGVYKDFYVEQYEKNKLLKGELSDVLFVLLHIGHRLEISATELLHMAALKMLTRMNDVNYIAKN